MTLREFCCREYNNLRYDQATTLPNLFRISSGHDFSRAVRMRNETSSTLPQARAQPVRSESEKSFLRMSELSLRLRFAPAYGSAVQIDPNELSARLTPQHAESGVLGTPLKPCPGVADAPDTRSEVFGLQAGFLG